MTYGDLRILTSMCKKDNATESWGASVTSFSIIYLDFGVLCTILSKTNNIYFFPFE
jgi:hypothetical protein